MATRTERKASAETSAHEAHLESWLLTAEWGLTDGGWKHPRLHWPWPLSQAAQLQREADDGAQGQVHRILRGEL